MMKLLIIQTGGTIDKDYPHRTKGWAFEIGEPAARRMLERLDPSFEYEVHTCFRKDSLEITDEDRKSLAELILGYASDRIIITHGTDTMLETAKYLDTRIHDKLIVITGAMRPERFTDSDAGINLGAAIATVQLKDQGIFIAMHGVVKPYADIKRDQETGKYY